MKTARWIALVVLLGNSQPLLAAEPAADPAARHRDGSEKLAEEQDELSADVQQLVAEQTLPQVIELLGEVEDIMDETVEHLAEADTGGGTIAAQTEIIEKIHAAAKQRQQQSGQGESGSAMMDMMERMMGKQPEGDKKGQGQGQGEQPGEQGGQGMSGASDSTGEGGGGAADGKSEQRRVPKAAGTAGANIPEEFRRAFDAYNRGLEKQVKP
jgi:hypothetical protein